MRRTPTPCLLSDPLAWQSISVFVHGMGIMASAFQVETAKDETHCKSQPHLPCLVIGAALSFTHPAW